MWPEAPGARPSRSQSGPRIPGSGPGQALPGVTLRVNWLCLGLFFGQLTVISEQ